MPDEERWKEIRAKYQDPNSYQSANKSTEQEKDASNSKDGAADPSQQDASSPSALETAVPPSLETEESTEEEKAADSTESEVFKAPAPVDSTAADAATPKEDQQNAEVHTTSSFHHHQQPVSICLFLAFVCSCVCMYAGVFELGFTLSRRSCVRKWHSSWTLNNSF